MGALSRLGRTIDQLNAGIGRAVAWLSLAMVLIGAYNAVARYLGRHLGVELSDNAYIEAQWYLFSALFLLGAADTLRTDGHVRVDVLHARLGPRSRALIDLLGTLLLLLPFCAMATYFSLPAVESSWSILEQSPDPGGLPRYPLKTLIPVSFLLLGLQGLSLAIKSALTLLDRDAGEAP